MKLFYAPFSPYARKCRVVLLAKGLSEKVELINHHPMDNPPELIAANPLGTVPALVLDDGTAFCESPVICEYLDSLSPGNPLFPADHKQRFEALALAALADGVMDAAVTCILENRRPEEKRSSDWIERKLNAAKRGIAAIAKYRLTADMPYSIGVIAVVCALDYISFRFPQIDWRAENPGLAKCRDETAAKYSELSSTVPKA